MLSDEENKMLEIFKKEVEKEQNEYEQVNEYTKFYYNNHKFILNLIEKQSKEIEKYKNVINNREFTWKQKYEETFEYVKENYTSNDKIKAKIEEVDYKMIAHQDVREAVKQALQSLLKKE